MERAPAQRPEISALPAIESFRRIADAMPHLVWLADPDGRIRYFNARWIDYTGFDTEDLTGPGPHGIVHPDERAATMAAWHGALATGEPYEHEYRLRCAADGSYRWFLSRSTPVRREDGAIVLWVGTATDIDERKHNGETLAFVLEAEEAFSGALGAQDVFETFAALAIKQFADWCFVQTFREPDLFTTVATAHRDARRVAEVRAFIERRPERSRAPLAAILREGPLLAPSVSQEQIVAGADDEDHLAVMRSLKMQSVMVVPVRVDGELAAAITLVSAESGRVFNEVDLGIASRIAARAAVALGTARRFEEERRTAERLRLISHATERLFASASLDIAETAEAVVRACVPGLADRAALYLCAHDGATRLVAADDVADAAALERAAELAPERVTRAIAEGQPAVLAARPGSGSALIVPLRTRLGTIGALELSYPPGSERSYGEIDLPLAQEVAARTASAVEAATRYEREHRVSQTFQSAALPAQLPAVPGTALGATYEAGRNEALVGGDWYDAFRLPDGRLVISIGDVAGSGLDAAVTMGSVRQSLRTAAVINPDPSVMLDALDRVVRAGGERYVTAFVAIFDPIFCDLRYASAGHPRPWLRTPDGRIEALHAEGLPLGLRDRRSEGSGVRAIAPGTALLFFTDGLTEVDHDVLDGEQRVAEAFAHSTPSATMSREVYQRVMGARPARDDVAILSLVFERSPLDLDEPLGVRWRFVADDAPAATAARRAFRDILHEAGYRPADVAMSEVVFGELVGNVVRHAPGPIEIVLDASGARPVLHVLDDGPGFELNPRLPADVMSERGRGLFIVDASVDEFTISRRGSSAGSHVRAVLRTTTTGSLSALRRRRTGALPVAN